MSEDRDHSEDALRRRLTEDQYRVTQSGGTEPAFGGKYYAHTQRGKYVCICCGSALFSSAEKYDSGTGWPSFSSPVEEKAVTTCPDTRHGMVREEVLCAACTAHLGHVFPDGPQPSGLRFCINSASLDFEENEET